MSRDVLLGVVLSAIFLAFAAYGTQEPILGAAAVALLVLAGLSFVFYAFLEGIYQIGKWLWRERSR